MTNHHDREKRALEMGAVDWFLEQYNEITKSDFRVLCHQERPDIILADSGGNNVGLEVAHLFYDAKEAKMLLGRSRDMSHDVETFPALLQRLNGLLQKKAEVGQRYCCIFPLWLLVRCTSPVFTGEDFRGISDLVTVPDGIYEQIWLLARDDWDQGWPYLFKLY